MIVSISGPCRSGKSTIISLLKSSLPDNTVYIEDIYYTAWEDMVIKGDFKTFTEIVKDSSFMFMYIYNVCKLYKEYLEKYKNYDGLVIMENCYLDFLIYSQLHTWYHYPIISSLEDVVNKFLECYDCIDKIYMTTPKDDNYPIDKDDVMECKNTKTMFKRNRSLELSFYNIHRHDDRIVNLPYDTLCCDSIILDDLKEHSII